MVFVHFEGTADLEPLTLKAKREDFVVALGKLLAKYEKRFGPHPLRESDLELKDAQGKAMTEEGFAALDPKADVFAVLVRKEEEESKQQRTRRRRNVAEGEVSCRKPREPSQTELKIADERVAVGFAKLEAKNYLEAKANFETALKLSGDGGKGRNARRGLGETYLRAGEPKKAIDEFEKCLVADDDDDPEEEALAYHDLARAYELNGDFSKCVKACECAILKGKQPKKTGGGTTTSGGGTTTTTPAPPATPGRRFDAATAVTTLSWALVKMNAAGDAVSLIEAVLKKDDKEPRAIRCYAAIAAKAEKWEEELNLLLRAVIFAQHDQPLRKDLARAIDRPGGVARLDKQLGHTSGAASAVAFLATVAKDCGRCWLAVDLLEWAATDEPKHGGYALNLLHAYEIVGDDVSAFTSGTTYLKNDENRVLEPGLSLKTFVNIIEELQGLVQDAQSVPLEWIPDDGNDGGRAVRKGGDDKKSWPLPSREAHDDETLDALAILFALTKIAFLSGKHGLASRLVEAIEPARRAAKKPIHETNARNEHAYYCCVAQLLCVDPGRRDDHSISPPAAVETEDDDNKKATTKKKTIPTAVVSKKKQEEDKGECVEEVYVCGDSHALSPAYKSWPLSDGRRLVLKPALVTGLKHWHLRPDCTFYPKHNFYNLIGLDDPKLFGKLGLPSTPSPSARPADQGPAVPRGATVLFLLGEIDCREGILVAVQKLRYHDLDEGIRKTAKLFVDAATLVVRSRQYRAAYVHPIPPVLDETRHVVRKYNAALKSLVDNSADLHFLDFFDQLLTDDKTNLKAQYRLDGTHLHPRYLDDLLRDHLLQAMGLRLRRKDDGNDQDLSPTPGIDDDDDDDDDDEKTHD